MGAKGYFRASRGFTLIELSIVLVIIGLIVGGVLVGRDLIKASEVRATIAQIEKFNTAANTFYGKYRYLPGDIPDPLASSFGFQPRGQYAGEGDGNGNIEGITTNGPGNNSGHATFTGETEMFWVDLSTVGLIDNSFNTATPTSTPAANVTATSNPAIGGYFPAAKLGGNNYFYVWSAAPSDFSNHLSGFNNFGIVSPSILNTGGGMTAAPGLTVQQAQSIDQKIDDGVPQQGNVKALFLGATGGVNWAAGGGGTGTPNAGATPASATTCYDNGGSAGTQHYSVEISNGTNVNCALSFKMQAGD